MIAFILAEIQILLLALDVVNFRNETSIDMFKFWQFVYLLSFIWSTLVLPFCFFFYDSDEDLPTKKRICKAFLYQAIYIVVVSVVHFPMYGEMRNAFIPLEA